MDYSKISNEQFDEQLARVLDGMSGEEIVDINPAYSNLREELNNKVLERFDMVEEIEGIIAECGTFSTADVEAERDPIVEGTFFDGLVHYFGEHSVDLTIHFDDVVSNEKTMPYTQLPTSTLEGILELAREWKEISEEE